MRLKPRRRLDWSEVSGRDPEAAAEASLPPRILLDACCLINLYATRRMREILETIPARFGVAERAKAEALYVRRGGAGEEADDQEAVDLEPLVAAGLLEVLEPETDAEAASFVSFAADLDDGEAMTCALAMHRDAAVATDDRKARRILAMRAPQAHVLSTADLLKQWSEAKQVAPDILARALADVQQRASFAPRRQDPLHGWWQAALRGS